MRHRVGKEPIDSIIVGMDTRRKRSFIVEMMSVSAHGSTCQTLREYPQSHPHVLQPSPLDGVRTASVGLWTPHLGEEARRCEHDRT